MEESLEKKSRILKIKSKFFMYRAITYSSFLLIPVWLPKFVQLTQFWQVVIMALYSFFMGSQWFLLGKEIDHRLKIYFKVNSSIDRVVYRILLGKLFFVIFFGLLSFLPISMLKHFFWGTWITLGLFYSWPTRGKIIEETISSQFSDFNFLDSFEKTVLYLIIIMYFVSLPAWPGVENYIQLKSMVDPLNQFSPIFWSFLKVHFFPFIKYPSLFILGPFVHFYLIGGGLFLLVFYSLLRYFFSRRLSILGVFSLISSWSFTKIIESNIGLPISGTYSLFWIWSILWCVKSSTYRSGLFIGLLGLWGTLLNKTYFLLFLAQLFFLLIFLLKDKTFWFKNQILKYASFGLVVSVINIIFSSIQVSSKTSMEENNKTILEQFWPLIDQKAFFTLAPIGFVLLLIVLLKKEVQIMKHWRLDQRKILTFIVSLGILFAFSLFNQTMILDGLSLVWILAFLALIPLEWIFQSMSRFRSQRNIIYLVYILICLLDSHFEGRVKRLLSLLSIWGQ